MFVPQGTSESRASAVAAAPARSRLIALVGVLVVALLAMVAPVAQPAAASDGYVDTDVLNLRAAPGTDSNIIGQMWQGEYVDVIDGPTGDGWYQVAYQGMVGWAYGAYLAIGGVSGWESSLGVGGVSTASSGGERWIDFDRSTQTVTLYDGNTPVASYWGAVGGTPVRRLLLTAIGTYYVYSKYAPISWTDWGQTYIKYWVGFDSYRFNGFHSYSLDAGGNVLPNGAGATGGCIATDLGAAAAIYEFSEIGMRVEVHW
ncbi:MAG: SH3 domain-containing protein [Thermomicrobiales bacterium]|nr:SH3 domain-containing protein [Thermomicrobiales bacterium]